MTREAWLRAHPYLEPVARLSAQLDATIAAIAGTRTPGPDLPCWDDYAEDFGAGVPLLRSTAVVLELAPADALVRSSIDELASGSAATGLEADARALKAGLERKSGTVVDWLLGDDAFVPPAPGLLRYVGWTALARYLAPVVVAFSRWRAEERWLRAYCPTCGAPPAMAQLVGVDPGRKRFLACGCCRTRWQYGRTGCPFCEHDSQRLGVVAVEGEASLRIDHCVSCRGYLKTYIGEGQESWWLADWSSLHLDLIAQDRGLKRLGASLFELEPAEHHSKRG